MAKKKSAEVTPPVKPQVVDVDSSPSTEYEYEEIEEEVDEEEEPEEVEEEPEEDEEVEEECSSGGEEENEEEESNGERSSESEEEDEEDENAKRKKLRNLLEPLSKEQIIAFLKEAAEKDPSIISRIDKSTESDPIHRRIFVHGLGWDATKDQVQTVFTQYGEIEECKVVMDKVTGKTKGYAFILFKTKAGAKKALKHPQKKIGNRMTSCQLSSTGGISQSQELTSGRKVFVSNVTPNINPYKLLSFFSTYGEIEEGPLGHDSITGKFKGFALFIYKTAEGCRKALEDPIKIFEGQPLECRLASEGPPKPNKIQPIPSLQTDLSAMTYGFGLNPALLPHYNMNPSAATALLGSNPGIAFANPLMAAAAHGLSQSSLPPAAPGLGLSILGNYGSQSALHGLGIYQTPQSAHSSATEAQRPQSNNIGSSSSKNYPFYLRR